MLPPPPLWSDCDTRTGSAAAAARSCVRRVEARAPWHSGGTALASVCMQAPSRPLRPSATVARGEDRSNIYHCQRQRVESIADRPVAHNAAGLVNFVERFWVGFSMGDLFLLSITCTCRLHGSVRRGSWSQVVSLGCGLHTYEVLWNTESPCARGSVRNLRTNGTEDGTHTIFT